MSKPKKAKPVELCDLEYEETPDDMVPWVVLFAGADDPEQCAKEWKELFGGES